MFPINLGRVVQHQTVLKNQTVLEKIASLVPLVLLVLLNSVITLTWHMTRPRVDIVCTWAKQTRIIECLFIVCIEKVYDFSLRFSVCSWSCYKYFVLRKFPG